MMRILIIFFLLFPMLFSCASSEKEPAPEPAPMEKEPEVEKEQSPPEEEPKEEEEKEEATENYTMTEQEKEKTKKDLSRLVSELNKIIASRNYEKWLTYLTEDYKEHYSDPQVLKEYSDAPVLKKYDITLRSLKDYFNYVVVASRRNVQVDDIKAISENRVKAYMYVDGNSVVVYTLEKVDGKWKITEQN